MNTPSNYINTHAKYISLVYFVVNRILANCKWVSINAYFLNNEEMDHRNQIFGFTEIRFLIYKMFSGLFSKILAPRKTQMKRAIA